MTPGIYKKQRENADEKKFPRAHRKLIFRWLQPHIRRVRFAQHETDRRSVRRASCDKT